MSVAPISLSSPQVSPKQIAAIGFGLIISGIVLLGMLGGLFVNTLLSQGQYEIQELQNRSIVLADEHERLAQSVSRLESPDILKNRALEMGMIPSLGSAFIDLRDGRLMGAGVDPVLNEPDPNVVTPGQVP
ncbi:MAG: hypothetical protein NWP59_00680 [Candidatus Nanopelagicales bacterium]|jgi:hypothetical protein|nr:hypothetical protein [Candidatus Nanopelagicales bacterium]MDP4746775.1 hypothetical protein [Candidatus Nanopelagicales bacterium]MDP4985873.1 hypothetical protein [Candidatus Nanopelagicales bacterium]MDP5107460.1 hypothetical protein [Candidatus Nanopelagicales bacterium]